MKNILGHTKEITLYGSCGNKMYSYTILENSAVETYYNGKGDILKQKTNSNNLTYDEDALEERMKVVGQNGPSGLHYENTNEILSRTFTNEPTWTQTATVKEILPTSTKLSKVKQQPPYSKVRQISSFIKSCIRILGYVLLPMDIFAATIILVVSAAMGILEELI